MAFDGRLATGERRGIGKGTLELLRSLVAIDAPIRLEILTDHQPPPDLITPASNWRWTVLRPASYPLWEQVTLPAYAARRRPALLHSPGNSAPMMRPPRRTRFVVTVHDFIFEERWPLATMRQRLGRGYRRLVMPRAIRRADWLTADSQATRRQLVDRFPEQADRVTVIPMPIPDQLFVASSPAPAEVDPSLPQSAYFLAFGGIDPRKNVERIVRAFQTVRAQAGEVELLLVGAQGAVFEQSVPGIKTLRYVPEPRLLELYRGCTALVYPSLSEGFGVPILEAMALGVPVITSNRDPMRELAGDVGILVDPEQVDSIAQAMLAIVRNFQASRERAQSGRSRAQQFSATRVAERLLDLYLTLARPAA